MSIPRVYAPEARTTGDQVALSEEEAEHLTRVLRLRAGAAVRVFDGRGHEFEALIARAAKQRVEVSIGEAREPSASEPHTAVTLAQAALKGDKMDDVVRNAVMMGVAAIQPIVTARSEVSLESLARGRRRDRWERIAIASAKQCGRAVVPPVLKPCNLASVLDSIVQRTAPGSGLMLVEPSAETADALTLADLEPEGPWDTTLLVGPEGGWTAEEISDAAHACRFLRLGSRTLRADATPLVALAALWARWGEL
jgi:16S rRNA (uracil1498-N3)-methyltransferase